MQGSDWHKCKFIESVENLKPLVKKRFGREPNTATARQISACLQQGRLFYEAAASSPLEIKPLQQFYGTVGFSKAIVLASRLGQLSSLRPAHGLKDISQPNCRIADLRVRIENAGTFQEFNDVLAPLTRLCYISSETQRRAIAFPSTPSALLCGIELSLREILSRVPVLESLYEATFGEESHANPFSLEIGYQSDEEFRLRIDDRRCCQDHDSLRTIVAAWRSRYPFLNKWRLTSAVYQWGYSIIHFRNFGNKDIDEFSPDYLAFRNGSFEERPVPDDHNERFTLEEGFQSIAGGLTGATYAVAPVSSLAISEFTIHYMGLFLLSSLVRYRPQTWTRAISRSSTPGETSDDQALSLIERFLDLNGDVIPQMVVTVLNPHEDEHFR